MKNLIVIRHAKSDWNNNLTDLDRPISDRGKNDVKVMSKVIDEINLKPEIIYSSPAKRTIETYENFLIHSSIIKNIKFFKSDLLYDFSGFNVLKFINNIEDSLSKVLIFSHNNSCSFLTSEFANKYIHVPTCGIIIFDFDVSSWKEITTGNYNHYFPKSFR
jgi:phosphohistidine phosphatase|tara:strand:+ start:834 stop:1316 length:483 start_codon:yes stop_codon:yes gene_type:complete